MPLQACYAAGAAPCSVRDVIDILYKRVARAAVRVARKQRSRRDAQRRAARDSTRKDASLFQQEVPCDMLSVR